MSPRERRGRPGWWLLTAAYAAAIWTFSSQQGGQISLPPGVDKLAHGLEFAGLGFLAARASGSPLAGFVVVAVWGAVDEVHQAFVPLRESDFDDWLADLAGGLVGAYLGARAARGQSERVARP